MSDFRIDDKGRKIPITDLGADLYPCKVCGVYRVLMLSWCNKCREEFPEEFEQENLLNLSILKTDGRK